MHESDLPASGWQFVADREAGAELIDALLALDAEQTYTKTEIAESAGVPLKTLYLNDLLDDCADLGLLARVDADTDGEARYELNADSPLLEAAAAFEDAYQNERK